MRSLLPAPARVQTFVDASLKARTASIAAAELERLVDAGAGACPRCQSTLCLDGYRRTETPYMLEEVLGCVGCGAQLLLRREERA